jgi:Tol biopolymer transport system component
MKSATTSDIWKLPLQGSEQPEKLVSGDCNDYSPGFRQDGSLAFLSNRSEDSDDGVTSG